VKEEVEDRMDWGGGGLVGPEMKVNLQVLHIAKSFKTELIVNIFISH